MLQGLDLTFKNKHISKKDTYVVIIYKRNVFLSWYILSPPVSCPLIQVIYSVDPRILSFLDMTSVNINQKSLPVYQYLGLVDVVS